MKYLLTLTLVCLALFSCHDDEPVDRATITYFEEHLRAEMGLNSLVRTFGEPSDDRGSGIHIYIYPLTDGTEIWIGFTDQILYANHVDAQQNVLKVVI
jgi:hypothetical protein